jgi:ferrochelatase
MAQGHALREALRDTPVAVGMRNWKPFIKEAVATLVSSGATRIVGIPLAPQFSTLSVGKYFDAATIALPNGIELVRVESFHAHPLLLDAFAERVRQARPQPDETVVFTAHSLPSRVIAGGDVYAAEFAATADGVASRAGIRSYRLAYQSAGRTPEPWIGPDISDLIREETQKSARSFLVAPVGFVCDHTEILFDIDVQAKATAAECGVELRRVESLNTSPTFIAMLADLARRHV